MKASAVTRYTRATVDTSQEGTSDQARRLSCVFPRNVPNGAGRNGVPERSERRRRPHRPPRSLQLFNYVASGQGLVNVFWFGVSESDVHQRFFLWFGVKARTFGLVGLKPLLTTIFSTHTAPIHTDHTQPSLSRAILPHCQTQRALMLRSGALSVYSVCSLALQSYF